MTGCYELVEEVVESGEYNMEHAKDICAYPYVRAPRIVDLLREFRMMDDERSDADMEKCGMGSQGWRVYGFDLSKMLDADALPPGITLPAACDGASPLLAMFVPSETGKMDN